MFSHLFSGIARGFATALLGFGLITAGPTSSSTPPDMATSSPTLEETAASLHRQISILREEAEKLRIKSTLTQMPKPKQSGEAVKQIQAMLTETGYLSKNVANSGYYGQLTQAAVKTFQLKNGLSSTGLLDDATENKLIEAVVSMRNFSQVYFPEESTLIDIASSSAVSSSIDQSAVAPSDQTSASVPADSSSSSYYPDQSVAPDLSPTIIYQCPPTSSSPSASSPTTTPATSTPSKTTTTTTTSTSTTVHH